LGVVLKEEPRRRVYALKLTGPYSFMTRAQQHYEVGKPLAP